MTQKTYTMIEAARVLVDGKCKGIRPGGDENYVVVGVDGGLVWNGFENRGEIYLPSEYVLGEWTLVEPQPTVILSGFLNIYPETACFHAKKATANGNSNSSRIACIPFSYSIPFAG